MIPYETYNNEIGVRLSFLISDEERKHAQSIAEFSYANYLKKALRNPDLRLREGRGKYNEVLIRFEALPVEIKTKLQEKLGHPVQDFNPLEQHFLIDEKARLFFEDYRHPDDDSFLSADQIHQYTINASVLNALHSLKIEREAMRRRSGNSTAGVWPSCVQDLGGIDSEGKPFGFVNTLKLKYKASHTLPQNERRLREDLLQYKDKEYAYLIDNRSKNKNAAKIKDQTQESLLSELLRKHNNYDNETVAQLYNTAAVKLGWKVITGATVANHKTRLGLYVYAGARGETNFRNKKSMQVKRTAPTAAMTYWTLDGWDAELLYQKFEDGKTTYHNRLTVVVVLDPVGGINYPIGYAIGTHETPELITEALRNAANHTQELFAARFRPLQLQSDRYAIKTLSPLYEAMSKYFTPGRVRNSKTKVVERYFLSLNKMAQKYYSNWSGFGVTADKENQPNADYLNKVRHNFPDQNGCREQIERLMQMERQSKVEQYLSKWQLLPEEDRLPLSTTDYLYLFGITHTHTNRLKGDGLTPTLLGQQLAFDTFDPRFRENAYMDWAIKYDPSDLSTILVLNAKSDRSTSKLKEVVGTHRFELQMKHEQPMALYDRKEGDAAALHQVFNYNKALEQKVIDKAIEQRQHVERLFIEQPQLNDTLTKMVLTDSTGQHKDVRNKTRNAYIGAAGSGTERPKGTPRKLEIKAREIPAPLKGDDFEIIDDDVRNEYGQID